MFPLRDENPTELTPYFTVMLIAVNVLAWVFIQGAGFDMATLHATVCRYGLIPAELTGRTHGYAGIELAPGMACRFGGLTWSTLLTGIFLHGSWLHLIGNMWFLWVFGNNIEDSMGHFRFLIFYLLTGVAASGVHIWTAMDSPLPTIGASGAVSGIMGAYLVLYPRVRVQTLFIVLIFIKILPVPAWLVLGQWFLLQFFYGASTAGASAGIAFWAHVGGFAAGALLIKLFENRVLVRAKKHHIKLSRRELENRGWW
ncbi:MAG TPA: rhomboid family intramembrane serine protease [Longimicrobiales bacterium]